jgi:transposase-like protein
VILVKLITGGARKFSPQFKADAVQMVIATGKPVAEVARDLGANEGTFGNWVKAWGMTLLSRTSRTRLWSVPA